MQKRPMARLAEQVVEHCRQIAMFSEVEQATTRTFLCPAMHSCHCYLTRWMIELGVSVHVDGAGNLRGVFGDPAASRFLIGSHLDTVPNAGRFDGILGVVLGIALIEAADRDLPFAIEVIGFSEEEGVRFGTPFLGSKALVQGLNSDSLALVDRDGISVAQAIRDFGLDPGLATWPGLAPKTAGYLEFHIEQGPVLDTAGKSLAIVDAIVGQSRAPVTFHGQANHAGTTPMPLRRDALAAAAEWISEVERYGQSTPGLVATVGKLNVHPNGSNVVPGNVFATIDVRHADDAERRTACNHLIDAAREIAAKRGLQMEIGSLFEQNTVPMDKSLIRVAERAFGDAGVEPIHLTSGAGHDAMIVAEKLPSAMVLLRSPGGISHHPEEDVNVEDVEIALRAGVAFLDCLSDWEPLSHGNA